MSSSSYIPLSDPDCTVDYRQNHRRPIKTFAVILSGCLLVALGVTLLTGNGGSSMRRSDVDSVSPGMVEPAVSRGVSEGVSEKSGRVFRSGVMREAYPWSDAVLAWQRTGYHFQPEQNWMNDPNGPMFYKGWYHFFYQYNPNAAVWGDIVWGHAVSADLINWFHLPIAMIPDHWYDIKGVWTGSATLLPDGQVIMLYTGSTKESVQVQNLAYPANLSDPLLVNWVKYSGNPVLVPPPGIGAKDFRDPTTAWFTPEKKWRITIGSKVNKTGISLVYDTEDFIKYDQVNGVLHGVSGTGMWECVDFYPVSKFGKNGLDTSNDGPESIHVLKASMDDDRNDYYALGSYDHKTGSWTPQDPKIDVGYGLRYDYGKFYAAKTFYDEAKKRRVLWGWITESDSETADIKKGWASLQSVPRTVLFDQKTGKNLIQWPIEEVESLRADLMEFKKVNISAGSVVPLGGIGEGSQLDIVAEFEIEKEALNRYKEVTAGGEEEYSCSTSGGAAKKGALGPFGIIVLADETLTEHTPIYFYIAKGKDGKLNTFFCSDQSRSSDANDVDKQVYGNYVPVLNGEKLTMRILVDHSIVESFAQGGRTCITSRVYPTKATKGATKVLLFNNATNASITTSVEIWHLNSAHIKPYPNEAKHVHYNRISVIFALLLFLTTFFG